MVRLSVGAAACILALAGDASASYSVSARTEVELYDLRSVAGASAPYSLPQQRLVQYLRLGAFDLGSRGPDERIDVVADMRLDENFGLTSLERRSLGITQPQLDLLYGYLQWKGALHGLLDATLGRQIVFQDMVPWAYDGLAVTVHPPIHLAFTALAGFLVTGTSPLGFPTFAPDGVRSSDATILSTGANGNLLSNPASNVAYSWDDAPQLVYGARLQLEGVKDVTLDVSYRKAQSRTSALDLQALPSGAKGYQVTVQRLVASGSWRVVPRLELYAAGDEDLFLERVAGIRTGVRVDVIPYRMQAIAEWSYTHPSFSADSIFNLFSTGPHQDAQVRVEASPKGHFTYRAGLLASGFTYTPALGETPPGYTVFLPGFFGGVATKAGNRYRAGADVFYLGDPGGKGQGDPRYMGKQLWLTLTGGLNIVPGVQEADLRLSAAEVTDPYQVALANFWSWDAAIISRSRLTRVAELVVIGEGSTNRYSRLDLRAYAALEIEAAFR